MTAEGNVLLMKVQSTSPLSETQQSIFVLLRHKCNYH